MIDLYRLSDAAELDLLEIWMYIARDNESAANRVLNDICEALELLGRAPGIGHLREDLTSDQDLRFFAIHSYLIIYRREGMPLNIVRILSGYRDIPSILRA